MKVNNHYSCKKDAKGPQMYHRRVIFCEHKQINHKDPVQKSYMRDFERDLLRSNDSIIAQVIRKIIDLLKDPTQRNDSKIASHDAHNIYTFIVI